MTRPREGNFSIIPLNLDRDQFEKFEENFGKGRTSELVRDFMKDENDRAVKEKKVMAPDNSPLCNYRQSRLLMFDPRDKKKQQTTLDVFSKIQEINNFINETHDITTLQNMKRNAHVIETITKTKLIKISKGSI